MSSNLERGKDSIHESKQGVDFQIEHQSREQEKSSIGNNAFCMDQNLRSSATNTGNVGGIGGDISVGGGNTLQDTENWSNPLGGKNIDEE